MIRVAGAQAALFCSDMHLDAAEPDAAADFLAQLTAATTGDGQQTVSHLFLLGDIFEAWVGDDQHDAVARATQQCLGSIAARGVAIFIMRGNRDFLLGEPVAHGFDWRAICTLLDDPCPLDCFGEPVLLAHGDAFCTADLAYQRFRAQRDQPSWRRDFLARPLQQRLELARQMRAQSRLETANKDRYLMDVSDDAVQAAMQAAGARVLVHGHTHRPAQHEWRHQGQALTRWVLPDWSREAQRGGFLLARASGMTRLGRW